MIHFCQTVFAPVDGAGGTGILTGAAAFAVFVVDVDFFLGNIRVICFVHRAVQIGKQVIHFCCFAKADHDRIDFLLGEDIVQCFLIMSRQTAAAEGFHGKYAFSGSMAGFDGFHHFLFCGKLVALADAKAGVIDEGEDHIFFFS